jgi:hypothetical protein
LPEAGRSGDLLAEGRSKGKDFQVILKEGQKHVLFELAKWRKKRDQR